MSKRRAQAAIFDEPFFRKESFTKERKGQAAIFDGIMFLLLVSISVAMMFSFLANYGQSQTRILQSSHLLNYVQSIGKTLYHVDAASLSDVDLADVGGRRWPYKGCSELRSFNSNTVADLIKRDVVDGKFDNKFGTSSTPNAPGKIALRCALKELMKPIVGAGYDYNAEILDVDAGLKPFNLQPDDAEGENPRIVTTLDPTNAADQRIYTAAVTNGCDAISQALKGKQLLAIATPFRVFDDTGQKHDHQLRICMWPSERI